MNTDTNSDGAALRELIDSSMTGVMAPSDTEHRARAAGRSLRHRRRAGLAALGVAAALVVGVPVATLATDDGGSDAPESSVATAPSTDPQVQAQWWTMPASEMAESLAGLLPDGVTLSRPELTSTDRASGDPTGELEGYLVARLTSEHGPGKVNLSFTPPEKSGGAQTGGAATYSCDPRLIENPEKTCTVIRDDEGTVIGQVVDARWHGVRSLGVTLAAPGGGTVTVDVANTLDDKWPYGATPSSDRVPLTPAQLRAIAADPLWTSYQP